MFESFFRVSNAHTIVGNVSYVFDSYTVGHGSLLSNNPPISISGKIGIVLPSDVSKSCIPFTTSTIDYTTIAAPASNEYRSSNFYEEFPESKEGELTSATVTEV